MLATRWGVKSTLDAYDLTALRFGAAGLILLPVAVVFFPPDRNMPSLFVSVVGLSTTLIAICFWKGEPPKWRWGREK